MGRGWCDVLGGLVGLPAAVADAGDALYRDLPDAVLEAREARPTHADLITTLQDQLL